MDPAEICQGVKSQNQYIFSRSQHTAAIPAANSGHVRVCDTSKVLDDDDLLIEIIVRLGFASTLIHAALVCKRWYRLASDLTVLRRFRRLHPPRLIGFYVATMSNYMLVRPHFVPMLPQPTELAAAVRHAVSYSLDAYDEEFTNMDDCQNDTFIISGSQGMNDTSGLLRIYTWGVHRPMPPGKGVLDMPVLPLLDHADGPACTAAHLLSKEEGNGNQLIYVWLTQAFVRHEPTYSVKYKAHVYVLSDDAWHLRNSASALVSSPKSDSNPLLVGNKIYMEHTTSIVAFGLTESSFSIIPLPQGMQCYVCSDMTLSRANDSGVYLIHLDGLQLHIWLHNPEDSTSDWTLADSICLRQMFDDLGMTDGIFKGERAALFYISQMGDNAEFVFFKMGQCALYLDVKRRELRKVYEETKKGHSLERIHPFTTTWPPTFPMLKDDHLRNAT